MQSTDDPERPWFISVLDGQLRPTEVQETHRGKGTGLLEQEPDPQPASAWPRTPFFLYGTLLVLIRVCDLLQAQSYVGIFKLWECYVQVGSKALPPREAPRVRDDTKAQAPATLGWCGTWN